jgi:hypothetical protein
MLPAIEFINVKILIFVHTISRLSVISSNRLRASSASTVNLKYYNIENILHHAKAGKVLRL